MSKKQILYAIEFHLKLIGVKISERYVESYNNHEEVTIEHPMEAMIKAVKCFIR